MKNFSKTMNNKKEDKANISEKFATERDVDENFFGKVFNTKMGNYIFDFKNEAKNEGGIFSEPFIS